MLDEDDSKFYRNWNQAKTDSRKQPRYENGVLLTRPINAPVVKLKSVQSKILRNVLAKIKLPEYFFGGSMGHSDDVGDRLESMKIQEDKTTNNLRRPICYMYSPFDRSSLFRFIGHEKCC